MTLPPTDKALELSPLLLRFAQPAVRPGIAYQYDHALQVNVLRGRGVPAVTCGFGLKTVMVEGGEDR
jgi:hypothetical protein